jgi:probable HAF family extracellular repeat protein
MSKTAYNRLIWLVGLAVCVGAASVNAAQYSITPLEPLAGRSRSWALGLNNLGNVVGYSSNGSSHVGQQRPVRWDRTGKAHELWSDQLVGGFLNDINDLGQIVGRYGSGDGVPLPGPGVPYGRAFIWDATSGLRDIGLDVVGNGEAVAINNRGQVVGTSEIFEIVIINGVPQGNFNPHPFIWDPNTGIRDLGNLGGYGGFASAINLGGQVIGRGDTVEGYERAFLWDETRGMQPLGSPPSFGVGSRAAAINDLGQLIGFQTGTGSFLWDELSGLRSIPIGGIDINNSGVVLGGTTQGFAIWDSVNGQRLLTDLIGETGWQISNANAINDSGEIVGNGVFNGQLRGFIMSPIPEPSTFLLAGSSIVAFVGIVLFRQFRAKIRRS